MVLPEYLEVQFGWVERHCYRTGYSKSFSAKKVIEDGSPYRIFIVESGQYEISIGECRWRLREGSVFLMSAHAYMEIQKRRAIQYCQVTLIGCRFLIFGNLDITLQCNTMTVWHPDRTQFHTLSILGDSMLALAAHSTIPQSCIRDGAMRVILGICWEAIGIDAVLEKLHPRMPTWLYLAMEHIRHNPSMSVNELAQVAGYSVSQFHRLFHQHVGMSPHVYLQQYRLSLAKHLLSSTKKSLTEIANHLGFTTASDFTRFYRSMSLSTPSEYRAMMSRSSPDVMDSHGLVIDE